MIEQGEWYSFEFENNEMCGNMEIDYEKLALAIVRAKKIEQELEEKQKAKERAEWQKSIGYNPHDDKRGIKKKVFVLGNGIKVFFNLMFFSKKKKLKVSATSAVMQSMTAMFFHLVKFMLWVLAVAFLSVVLCHGNKMFGITEFLYYTGFACIAFVLSCIFRLMAIEIEQMSDGERIIGIFTAVLSVIPMIEIIAGFLKEV